MREVVYSMLNIYKTWYIIFLRVNTKINLIEVSRVQNYQGWEQISVKFQNVSDV
jgi:hypothetical protein